MGEYRALQLAQAIPGLDPELAHEHPARVLVHLQRVGLAITAVEGEHELAPEALAIGVLGDQRRQPGHHGGVPAQLELRFDELLEGGDAQLLEPRDGLVGESLIGEVGERRATPQAEPSLEGGGRGRRPALGQLPRRPGRAAPRSGAHPAARGR